MNDILPILFVALIAAVIGLLAGLWIGSLRTNAGENQGESEQGSPSDPDLSTIQVSLDRKTGQLQVDVNRRIISSPAFLDGEEHEHMALFYQKLGDWLGIGVRTSDAKGTPREFTPPVEKPKGLSPTSVIERVILGRKSTPEPRSIAAQIDEILQEKLSQKESANLLGVRLMELPGKGMVVMLGMNQYDGIEAVPDPEVRNLLRACVAEWEARVGGD